MTESIDEIQKRYKKLTQFIFKETRGTNIDKIDDYLIGITKNLNHIDQEEIQKEEEKEIQENLLIQIINFPKKGAGLLEEFIPGRTYSLLTLFCLLGNRLLIYALVNLGISILDFDWTHHFHCLSDQIKLTLNSIRKTQRKGKPLKIPGDIQRTLQEIQDNSRPSIQRNQTASLQEIPSTSNLFVDSPPRSYSTNHDHITSINYQKTGTWVGNYFLEDYEQDSNQCSIETEWTTTTRIPAQNGHINQSQSTLTSLPNSIQPINSLRASSTTQLQRKLNKLKSLRNNTTQPTQQSTSIIPSPPPTSTLITPSNLISPPPTVDLQNSNLNDSNLYFNVQISNLPVDASRQSILLFLQNGPDIFKTARTQNQKIDALGRNIQKFKNNWYPGKPKASAGGPQKGDAKYSLIKETDIDFINQRVPAQKGCQASQTIVVHFHPGHLLPSSSHPNLISLVNSFILAFHNKKFFPLDFLSLPISCTLLSN